MSLINSAETMAKNGQHQDDRMVEALKLMQQVAAEDPRNLKAKFDVAETYRTWSDIRQPLGDNRSAAADLEESAVIIDRVSRTDLQNIEAKNLQLGIQKN